MEESNNSRKRASSPLAVMHLLKVSIAVIYVGSVTRLNGGSVF